MAPPPRRVRPVAPEPQPQPTSPPVAQSRAIANYEDELARMAQEAAKMEASAAGGEFFSTQNGILKFNSAPLPGNQVAAIIVDHCLENVYYEGDFDPSNPSSPLCYAFGTSDQDLQPHENVVQAGNAQHETCKGCPMNEWGSADTGRGKACRNTRRLALIPAGGFSENGAGNIFEPPTDPSELEASHVAFLKLPVTSVKAFAGWVQQVASVMKRPPFAVFSRIRCVPDAASQFRVVVEALGAVPNAFIRAAMAKREECQAALYAPYPDYAEPPPPPPRKAPPAARRERVPAPEATPQAAPPARRRF